VLGTLALAVACSSRPPEAPPGEAIPDEYVLQALEAYRGDGRYFIRYRRGPETYYAAGDLRARRLPTGADPAESFEPARMEPLRTDSIDDWQTLRADLISIPVLSIDDWAAFRNRIFSGFMPSRPGTGVAVSLERGDYFFFYDRAGRFRARRLIDKPPWYEVTATIDLEQFYARWRPLLRSFLAEKGLQEGEVMFNTGDLDAGAIPFIYINTDSNLIVLIQYDEFNESDEGGPALIPGSHWLQSLWHFIGSHTYSVPMRPFTSAQSLLTLLSDTALESGRTLTGTAPPARGIAPLYRGAGMNLVEWEHYLDQTLGRSANRGTVDFLVDGDRFFPRFVDVVTSADSHVDIRAYIFDNDDVALEIAELLKRRSREGIDVRVLLDGLGTILAGGDHASSTPDEHRPPLSIHQHLEQRSDVTVRAVKNTWLMGDHVKTMVVDRRIAFLGGMNIGREYRYDWHDLMMELQGPVVDTVNREFESAWHHAGWFGDFGVMFHRPPAPVNAEVEGHPLRLVYTRPGQQEIFRVQREAIRRARRYIFIENAYFTDDQLLHELIAARQRGVDVRVIIPLETDRGLITRNIATAANHMLEAGIRVYIFPGFTHAKAAIFDGWVCVGSANFDRLSLRINREINVASSEPSVARELLDELFLPDFRRSAEMKEPFTQAWGDQLIELLGDYMF
jgi:cardiolipin synthase